MRAMVLLVAACGFHTHELTGDSAVTDASGDAAHAGIDAAIDSPGSSFVLCNPQDLDLRACFTFDGSIEEGSSYSHSVSSSNTSFTAGHDGQAVVTGSTSSISVGGDVASFDISVFTFKMWIKPNSLPATGLRMGLIDSGNRYRMFLLPGGELRCAITSGPDLYSATGVVTTGVWQRVACTFDGNTTTIYVNGNPVATLSQTATINSSSSGIVIGQNNPSGEQFDGAIDDFQLWGSIVAP